jgi:hypothetical protein
VTIRGAAQHQSTATHVAPTDKVRRKSQSIAKVCQQHVDVFPSGDAAKENHFALGRQFVAKCRASRSIGIR